MNTQHTPGPWEQKIQSCGFWSICSVYGTEQGWIWMAAISKEYWAKMADELAEKELT